MRKEEKFLELWETRVNGNISDFNKAILGMRKKTLVEFLGWAAVEMLVESPVNVIVMDARMFFSVFKAVEKAL